MGAVRPALPKLPKVIFTDPCVPASKHDWELVQRRFVGRPGQFYLLFRCLHCANSVYSITKPYTRFLFKPPRMSRKRKLT